MGVQSRYGEVSMAAWLGAAVGLVPGTAALAILTSNVLYGVEFVPSGAAFSAPALSAVRRSKLIRGKHRREGVGK